jgi:pectate lyase
MRRVALLATAALVVGTAGLNAQMPNFAGKWTMQADPNAAAPAGGRGGRGGFGGLGQEVTITQDAKTLTTVRTTQNGEIKTVYNLDGSESKNTMSMGGNDIEQVSVAKWTDGKLVITTTMNFNGNARETTMSFALDASGNLLVSSTRAGRGGGDPVTTTTTYTKS